MYFLGYCLNIDRIITIDHFMVCHLFSLINFFFFFFFFFGDLTKEGLFCEYFVSNNLDLCHYPQFLDLGILQGVYLFGCLF